MKEIWGIHPKTGLYVSSHGRIITKRKGVHRGCQCKGYLVVRYNSRSLYIHRLIAETFIPNPENKPEVNHKNGDRADNRVENLEWATHKENIQHAVDTGLQNTKGEAHSQSKLTEAQVREIRQNAQGLTQRALAAKYGVSKYPIQRILAGKSWKHV